MRPSAGRPGLQIPCVFWPSTYVHQEILAVAASPEGEYVAAATHSGQVYIWRCTVDHYRGSPRLDPIAVALSGWLGSVEIISLEFCSFRDSAEVVGLSSGLLLVCLLKGGCFRLLDVVDGRCVAAVPGRQCADPTTVISCILQDQRHVVLANCTGGPVVIDLWSGRPVAHLATSSDGLLLHLAAPHAQVPEVARQIEMAPKKRTQLFAAVDTENVVVWRWTGVASDGMGRQPERLSPFWAANYARNRWSMEGHPVALAFESGKLLLGLPERAFIWLVGEATERVGPQIQVDHAGGGALTHLAGATLVGADHTHLVAWTTSHQVYITDLGDSAESDPGNPVLISRWGTIPETSSSSCSVWWKMGSFIAGAFVGLAEDVLHLRAALPEPQVDLPTWTKATCLEQLWQPDPGLWGTQVTCATIVESPDCTCFAVGLVRHNYPAVCIAHAIGRGAGQQLELPNGFSETCCLTALGPHFLAAGDTNGFVCWWEAKGWRLAGQVPPPYRARVLHIARVWSPRREDGILVPEPVLVAALDMLGKCRLINLETSDVLCLFQSQSGPSLWLDSPFRFTYDSAARYICVVTPSGASVWDAGSGAFEGGLATADRPENVEASQHASQTRREAEVPAATHSGPVGLRCSKFQNPGFGIEAVAWQASMFRGADIRAWCAGDAMLGGCEWRLPILLLPAAGLSGRPPASLSTQADAAMAPVSEASQASSHMKSSGPEKDAAAETEAATVPSVHMLAETTASATASSACNTSQAPVPQIPLPVGGASRQLQSQLSSIGLKLRHPPLMVGAIGVDDCLSFPLPRRRGPAPRSADSSPSREAPSEEMAAAPACATSASVALLQRVADQVRAAASVETKVRPPRRSASTTARGSKSMSGTDQQQHLEDCPHVGLAFLARLLLDVDSSQQTLQRYVLPAMRQLLNKAPMHRILFALSRWLQVLQSDPKPSEAKPTVGATVAHPRDCALRHAALGSAAALRDAATLLLAAVAHVQPRLFEQCCSTNAAEKVAESLCARALGRIQVGSSLQGLACDLLAAAFPFWQKHLAAALPRRPASSPGAASTRGSITGGTGAPRNAAAGGAHAHSHAHPSNASPVVTSGSGVPRPGTSNTNSVQGSIPRPSAPPSSQRSPSPDAATKIEADEDLEWLATQMLMIYQDQRVAPSCLHVMMQVGAAEPAVLIHVMGKAARRLDAGPAYASSALLVLVAFIQRFASKALPLVPRLTEVVLRCLEPSDPSLRRQSLLAVTSALHELVKTFPMVAFHQTSQKFAVGTSDGPIVVYDLRTATKWRILEGHTGAIAALTFSQDGSKLGSYSGQECTVRFWQCNQNGFFGGLLGTSGRCLKTHRLPSLQVSGCSSVPAGTEDEVASHSWRGTSFTWSERGPLRLVRENGEVVQIGFE